MKQPVIFLAFSNPGSDSLGLLEKERKMIANQLIPLESKQFFQLHVEPSATLGDVIQYFTLFKDRIVLFHYGGHAGEAALLLEDGSADAAGLANIFALQKELKCIFLNGCSTRGQVNYLLKKGVPAVIATRAAVADTIAYEFAEVFYQALVANHTLQEAFQLAAGNYQAQKGEALKIFKGDEVADTEEELPWGLYVKKSQKEVLRWKLPSNNAASIIIRGGGQFAYDKTVNPNVKLIETIANAIAPYSSTVKSLIDGAKSVGKSPQMRELRAAVINAFPTPIGFHLRKLVMSADIDIKRLQKLSDVYTISTQLLAYILLAQLWDEKYSQPKIKINEKALGELKNFFSHENSCFAQYDFIRLIRAVGMIFEENDISFFIEEFKDLQTEFRANTDFHKACDAMLEIKQMLGNNSIEPQEVESLCVQAEQHLCVIFEKIGFAAKYTLMTIKNIELIKIRHQEPKYKHNLVILDKLTASFGELDDTLVSSNFGENESVLLLLDEENIVPNLNLSPFLIDENALTGQKNSKIFLWDCRTDNSHQYLLSDNLQDTLNIASFTGIQTLLNRFITDVLGENNGVEYLN